MQAKYKDGSIETWTGLGEDEARQKTVDRALNPDVEFVAMMSGDIKELPARNRHERRRDAALDRRKPKASMKRKRRRK